MMGHLHSGPMCRKKCKNKRKSEKERKKKKLIEKERKSEISELFQSESRAQFEGPLKV